MPSPDFGGTFVGVKARVWLIVCLLLAMISAVGSAGRTFANPGAAGGSLFIQPVSPRVGDTVVVSYPQRSCGAEQADIRRNGRDFEITISFQQTCLSAIDPLGNPMVQVPGGIYRQVVLGRLPEGNYRVRLYYRDLSQGRGSSSFSIDESFSVMPNR